VRARAMNTAFGEDDELASRNRKFNAVLDRLIEVEGISCLVEAFFTAKANLANSVVCTLGKSQASAFRRGIIDRHPNGQLENLATIGREDTRILVVFYHERARLMPLNGGRLRAFVKILRTPHKQIRAQQLRTTLGDRRTLHVVPQPRRFKVTIARRS